MTEQSNEQQRDATLPEVATVHERTVQRAAEHAEQSAKQRKQRKQRSKRSAVDVQRPRIANADKRAADESAWKQAWALAQRLADGDTTRIVRTHDALIVCNSTTQAARLLSERQR